MKLNVQSMNGNTALGMETATVRLKNPGNTGMAIQRTIKSSTTRKKALNYNSREISSQLLRAAKARTASNVLSKAKSKLAQLNRCKGSGQYNDGEVEAAIAHAKRMVKCAQLKFGNLKQEEAQKKSYEREAANSRQQKKNEVKRKTARKERELSQKVATEELQQSMKEKAFRRDLARKRRMHRDEECSKIMEAEMKFLQDKLNSNDGSAVESMGVSFDLSSAAMNMAELQVKAEYMEMAAELAAIGTGAATGSVTSGEALTTGGSVNLCV